MRTASLVWIRSLDLSLDPRHRQPSFPENPCHAMRSMALSGYSRKSSLGIIENLSESRQSEISRISPINDSTNSRLASSTAAG